MGKVVPMYRVRAGAAPDGESTAPAPAPAKRGGIFTLTNAALAGAAAFALLYLREHERRLAEERRAGELLAAQHALVAAREEATAPPSPALVTMAVPRFYA